jgi:cell wall-associated NlpC family hydrolase
MTGMLRRLAVALALMATASAAAASSTAVGTAGSAAVRERAVSWAVKQVGTREIGTTNCSPVIDRWERQMGLRLPPCRVWCGAFVHQAFRRAGVQLSERLIDPDRSYADALAGRRGLKSIPISSIQRGDIVFYKLREGVRASHLGIARGRPSGDSLSTVEGNTSNAVRLERRGVRYIVLAARVTGDA